MEEKIIITESMVSSFANMLKSGDVQDSKLAVEFINNRDKTDLASEENFMKIANQAISNEKLFPKSGNCWVIKIGKKVLTLGTDRTVFDSEKKALGALSYHFTTYLGKVPSPRDLTWKQRNYIKKKTIENYNESNDPRGPGESYDPKFNKKEFIETILAKLSEQAIDHKFIHARNNPLVPYLKALKMMFKGGKEMRDFLIKNKVIEIVKLESF